MRPSISSPPASITPLHFPVIDVASHQSTHSHPSRLGDSHHHLPPRVSSRKAKSCDYAIKLVSFATERPSAPFVASSHSVPPVLSHSISHLSVLDITKLLPPSSHITDVDTVAHYGHTIIDELEITFGGDNIRVVFEGEYDRGHAFIEVSISLDLIETAAEELNIPVRSRRGYAFHSFERNTKRSTHRYAHPNNAVCPYRESQRTAKRRRSLDREPNRDVNRRPSTAEQLDSSDSDSDSDDNDVHISPCECEIFTPYQRDEIIRALIERAFDNVIAATDGHSRDAALVSGRGLKLLRQRGIVIDMFPMHNEPNPSFYRDRQTFMATHCSMITTLSTSFHCLSRHRPYVSYIRDYFGEKTAIYFVFLHFYNTALLYLMIPGIIAAAYQYGVSMDNPLMIVYGVLSIVWAGCCMKLWRRQCADWLSRWGTTEFQVNERESDAFIRHTCKHPLGGHLMYGFYANGEWVDMSEYAAAAVKRYDDVNVLKFIPQSHRDVNGALPAQLFINSKHKTQRERVDRLELNAVITRQLKVFFGGTVILTLLAVVTLVMLWLLILAVLFESMLSTYGNIVSGVINAFVMIVLDSTYRHIALKLTEWEYHRTATLFENALAVKTFVFRFINAYFLVAYLAFVKPFIAVQFGGVSISPCRISTTVMTNGALSSSITDTCMVDLSDSLLSVLLTRMIIGIIMHHWLPRVQLEARMIRRLIADNHAVSLTPADIRKAFQAIDTAHVEYQSALPKYETFHNILGVFDDYTQLCINYGYVLMFATALPIAPLILLINNIVIHYTDTYKLFYLHQKHPYFGERGIGFFYSILQCMTVTAVISNLFIVLFTSDQISVLRSIESSDHVTLSWLSAFGVEHALLFVLVIIWNGTSDLSKRLRIDTARMLEIKDTESLYADWLSSHVNDQMNRRHSHRGEDHQRQLIKQMNFDRRMSASASPRVSIIGRHNAINQLPNQQQFPSNTNHHEHIHAQRDVPSVTIEYSSATTNNSPADLPNRPIISSTDHLRPPNGRLPPMAISKSTRVLQPIRLDINTHQPLISGVGSWSGDSKFDLCFPFTISNIGSLQTSSVSDCCIDGPHVYRLYFGRSETSLLPMYELTVRYVSGPLPHTLTSYLVAIDSLTGAIAFRRYVACQFDEYGGRGLSQFASTDMLSKCGAIRTGNDTLTVGLIVVDEPWERTKYGAV